MDREILLGILPFLTYFIGICIGMCINYFEEEPVRKDEREKTIKYYCRSRISFICCQF